MYYIDNHFPFSFLYLGVCVQTETVLRQALAERIRPVLMINKLDRCIFETQLEPEELYCKLRETIEHVNVILSTYSENDSSLADISVSQIFINTSFFQPSIHNRTFHCTSNFNKYSEYWKMSMYIYFLYRIFGHLQLDPSLGNVAFGSGLHRWGFTLRRFAKMYAAKLGHDEEKLMKRLWGNHYYNQETRKWSETCGEGYVRGFNKFILEPLFKVLYHLTYQIFFNYTYIKCLYTSMYEED